MLNRTGIEQYFMAQKQAGLVFIVIGVLAALAAIAGWLFYKTPFWKGAAIPFILVGLMQIVAGYRVYTESDALRISNVYALDMNPQLLKTNELPRMQAIHKRFALYSSVQWAVLGIGILLLLLYRHKPEYAFWYGFGVALAIQAVVLIVVYYFAAQRANAYTAQIHQFVQQL